MAQEFNGVSRGMVRKQNGNTPGKGTGSSSSQHTEQSSTSSHKRKRKDLQSCNGESSPKEIPVLEKHAKEPVIVNSEEEMAQRSSIQAKQLNSTEDVAQVSLPSTPSQTSATRPASSSAAHIVIAGLPEAEGLLSTAPTKSNRQRKSRTAEPESTDQTESNRGNDQMIIEGNSNDGFAPAADGIDNANAQTNSYGIREVVSSRSRKEAQRRNEKGKQPAIAPGPPNLLTRTRSSTSTLIAQDDEHISTTADASTVSKSKEAVYGHVHEALKELERGITVSRAHAALRDYYFYAEALLDSHRKQLNSANERALKAEEGLGQTQELLKEVLKNGGGDESHLARAVHCTICMEPFAEPHVIDCGHSYCYTCLSLWLKKSRSCPSCRAVVKALPVRNRALLECVEAHISRMEPAAAETARSRVRREQGIEKNFRNLVSPWSEIMPFGLADPIDDEADQVLRCPMCTWEVVDGLCVNCGAAYGGNMSSGEDVEVLSDYSDSDISGHSRIYLDDEAEEVEDSEDEEHYIRQFRQDFGSPAFSGSNHSISSDGSYSPGRFAAESPDYIPRSDAWFPRGSNNRSQSPDYYSAPATPEHASNSDEDMYSPERSPQNYLIFNNDEIILRSRRMQPVQYRELSEGEEEGEDVDDDDIIVRPVRRPPIFSDDESGEGHDVDEPIEEDEADGEDDLTVGRGVSRIPKRVIISDDSSEEESENGQLNGTDANERAGVGSDDDGKEDDNSDDEIIRRLPKRKSPWMVTETGDMEFESSSSNGREGMARAVAVPSRSGAGRPPRWAQQGLRAAVPELSSGQERRQDGMSNRRGCLANTHGENADSYTSSGPLESPSRYEEDTDGEQTDSSIRLPISNRPTRRSSNEDQSCDGLDDEDGVGESVEEPSDDEDNRSPSNAQFILDLRRPRTWHQAADTSNGNEQVGKYWNKPRFSALPLRLELDMSAAASSNHKTKHSCETSDEPLIAHGMLEFERQWRETLRQHTEATKEVRRLIEGSRCSCDVFDPWLRRSEHVNVRVGVGSECSSDDEENCITVTSVRPRRLPPLREKPA